MGADQEADEPSQKRCRHDAGTRRASSARSPLLRLSSERSRLAVRNKASISFARCVRISKESSQALDNQTLELGGRQALSGLVIALPLRLDARDQTARDIVAIAYAFLDCVG
jgi:hypothetical protein